LGDAGQHGKLKRVCRNKIASEKSCHFSPRLDLRECILPLAHLSISAMACSIKGLGGVVDAVCSRAVNAGSVLVVRKRATVVRRASKRHDAGGVGMPISTIGPARRAKSGGVSRVGVIGNGAAKPPPRQCSAVR